MADLSHNRRKEQDYLDVFHQVTKAVSSSVNLDEVINLVVTKSSETLGVAAATVRLLDEHSSKLILVGSCGLSEQYLKRGPLDSEESIAEVLTGRPVFIYDAPSDPRIEFLAEAKEEGIKSILAVPIITHDKPLGVLRLLTREPRQFTQDEIKFVVSLAEHCGIAIEHIRSMEARTGKLAYLESLHEVSRMVNTTLDIDTILDRIVQRLPEMTGVQAATVRLLDETGDHLILAAATGLSEKYLSRGSLDSEEAIRMVLQGKPVAIKDATTDPRLEYTREAREEGIASILAVPIAATGEIIGVLRLLSTTVREFSEDDIRFVSALAEQSGIAIRNAMHYEEVNRLLETIKGERRFLQHVVDSLDAQLLAIDLEKNIILANAKFADAHNLTKGAVVGKKCDSLETPNSVDPGGHCTSCPLEEVRKTKSPLNFATRSESLDGAFSFFDVILAPILNREGEVENIIEIIRDVTHQWEQEQRILEAEKMKCVLETSAAVSHELNSPIFAALGTAQLMRRELDDKESLREDIDLIIRNMQKIRDLTGKIGRISKYQTRDYVGEERLLDIHGLDE